MPDETKITENSASKKNKTLEINSLEVYEGRECCRISTVRSIWYLFSFVLLWMVTPLIFIALFTNNWLKTASSLVTDNSIINTQGVFFLCRQVKASWINYTDIYCKSANSESNSWLIAVQIFYTLGAVLNLISVLIATYGLFKDLGKKKQAVSSFMMWFLLVSSLFQLIAISLYGHRGIGDYAYFEPDYSIICASIALAVNFVCAMLFMVDIYSNRSKRDSQINDY